MDLLDIPEEIASQITGGMADVLKLVSAGFAKAGAELDALSARLDALEHHGDTAPPST